MPRKTLDPADPPALPPVGAPGALSDPSSFLSSRWPRDNVLTPYPPARFDGAIRQTLGIDELLSLLEGLKAQLGPFEPIDAHRGVFSWDVTCRTQEGTFALEVPVVWDHPGTKGRSKQLLPARSDALARKFHAEGLCRHLQPASAIIDHEGLFIAKRQLSPSEHLLTFGRGGLLLNVTRNDEAFGFSFSLNETARLLSEVVAAIAYHYDPDQDGGTTLCDLYVNDGDFVARRLDDGKWQVRLRVARGLQSGVGSDLFLNHLVQLCAYEEFGIHEKITGLPVLMSDPSIAFCGFEKGARLRALDRGTNPETASDRCRALLDAFSRSRFGHCYRPWVELFLAGSLPPRFGDDLRHRWWQLSSLQEKAELHALRAGSTPLDQEGRAYHDMLRALSSNIGVTSWCPKNTLFVNEVTRSELEALLGSFATSAELFEELRCHAPFRDEAELTARVPRASVLVARGLELHFGAPLGQEAEGTVSSLSRSAPGGKAERRLIANREFVAARHVPSAAQSRALEDFPTFEAFMDLSLFDEECGFYSKSVRIGRDGHFTTHPERFSPHYGRWVARAAFLAWSRRKKSGLDGQEPFFLVEFGGGTGRLARDVLDAIHADENRALFGRFAEEARYTIYEQSETLRAQQRELLGDEARVLSGDARQPHECLSRDFPSGLSGFVFSNELPDAFGVHKLLFDTQGHAQAALVVPRVEKSACRKLSARLAEGITRTDARLRSQWAGLAQSDHYLLDTTWLTLFLREAVASAERESLLGQLWCDEAYVDAERIPALSEHLRLNEKDYERALQKVERGVVLYANCHAERHVREVAESLQNGALLLIDYGDSTDGLVEAARRGHFAFRVYRDTPEGTPTPNDPYAFPGTVDLTADVNFSALVRAGEAAGLRLVHYGHERDLVGEDRDALLAQVQDEATRAFLAAPVFKMLLMDRGL